MSPLPNLSTALEEAMSGTELIVITLAVLLSPLIALQVQQRLDVAREKRGRRAAVFYTLMSTRGARYLMPT
jgi:hypothetical protein